MAGIDGEKAPNSRAWVAGPEDATPKSCPGLRAGAPPGREAQETWLMEPSTKLYHIRALGRGGGTRATLALQAPASPASLPRPAPLRGAR